MMAEIERQGISTTDLARAANVKRDIVRDLERRPVSSTSVERAQAIAHALGLSLDEMLQEPERAASITGVVSSSAQVELVDRYDGGADEHRVWRPAQLVTAPDLAAILVRSGVMQPVYQPGHLLFYEPRSGGVPDEALDRPCVVELTSGETVVGFLRRQDANAHSVTGLHATSRQWFDVAVTWASPIRLAVPSDLARYVTYPPPPPPRE